MESGLLSIALFKGDLVWELESSGGNKSILGAKTSGAGLLNSTCGVIVVAVVVVVVIVVVGCGVVVVSVVVVVGNIVENFDGN